MKWLQANSGLISNRDCQFRGVYTSAVVVSVYQVGPAHVSPGCLPCQTAKRGANMRTEQ
jgi:hypothetical protein